MCPISELLWPYVGIFLIFYIGNALVLNQTWDEHLQQIPQLLRFLKQQYFFHHGKMCVSIMCIKYFGSIDDDTCAHGYSEGTSH